MAAAKPERRPKATKRGALTVSTTKRPAPGRALPAPRPASIPSTEQASPSLAVALFNTGDLLIELPEQPPMRLTRDQTAELVAYLSKLDQLSQRTLDRHAA